MKTKTKTIIFISILILAVIILTVAAVSAVRGKYGDRYEAAANGDGGDMVVAEVNGEKIYEKAVRTYVTASDAQAERNIAQTEGSDDETSQSIRQNAYDYLKKTEDEKHAAALEVIINNKLADLKCRDLGIYPTDDELRPAYEENKNAIQLILDGDDEQQKATVKDTLELIEAQRKALGMTEEEYEDYEMHHSFASLFVSGKLRMYYKDNVDKDKYPTFDDYVKSFRDEYKVKYRN